nr:transglutaminase domain-containing protein [Kibdelosporangium sp. MJ126-NF4]CEL20988.1 FIG001454: Transglutaminase-like enzymes, putative cysteine proteases [Kibdelosporangium sp. MJ126-NF4]CTQ95498.1 FIG001454: Transglutaminase-like enzymes, putative cysteine proteases [Kibdelosporangium sp. MJ126-NF4]
MRLAERVAALWVLLAAAIPGLLFAPVFGVRPLLVPVAVVVVACYAAVELCLRVKALQAWRPLIAAVLGLLSLCVAMFGVPDADSLGAMVAGVTDSWQLTVQSTWPVRPDAESLLFVPLLVLLAAVLGIELLRWPATALLPSVAVLVVSQAFVALSGTMAVLAALGFAVVAAGLYIPARPGLVLVPTAVLGVLGAAVAALVNVGQPYSVQQNHSTQVPLPRTVSPLTEVAARLSKPDVPVFSYTANGPVDRWRLVVLTEFNGVTWEPSDGYRRLGTELSAPVGAPSTRYSARIQAPGGQWLPSQAIPAAVTGAAPLVEPATGALLLPGRKGAVEYDLSWWDPQVEDKLWNAALSSVDAQGGLGVVPPEIPELAATATAKMRPSFRTALLLEQYLRENYKVVTGGTLPTGSGWPQLREFLLETKQGTSEQFAASYVALARVVGIPARLAVGYRAPRTPVGAETIVHNRDVLVWPEVAVAGVGWVPLDPAVGAGGAGPAPSRLAQITAEARYNVQPPDKVPEPPLPPTPVPAPPDPTPDWMAVIRWALIGLAVPLGLFVLAVPTAKTVRTLRRRRRKGADGVVAAWWEARDLMRAHGTRVTPGMTARDLARTTADASIVDALWGMAGQLDVVLWSGSGADDHAVTRAWAEVRRIRRTLAGRTWGARLRAVFAIR